MIQALITFLTEGVLATLISISFLTYFFQKNNNKKYDSIFFVAFLTMFTILFEDFIFYSIAFIDHLIAGDPISAEDYGIYSKIAVLVISLPYTIQFFSRRKQRRDNLHQMIFDRQIRNELKILQNKAEKIDNLKKDLKKELTNKYINSNITNLNSWVKAHEEHIKKMFYECKNEMDRVVEEAK